MKKFIEMTYDELAVARRERNDSLGELYTKANNREFTAEEKQQEINLTRELKQIDERMKTLNRESEHSELLSEKREQTISAQFREFLQDVRVNPGKVQREITLAPQSDSDTHNIEESGAINLTIHDLIPTLQEGLGLPKGLNLVTGVVGNELWPVSVDDVEMEEVGEIEALSDQVLNFTKITPTVKRCGLTVPVSNMAIDNAAFDLMGFVQKKFDIAQRKYLAKKLYPRAEWTGNKGPFSGLNAAGVINIGDGNEYKNILAAIANFSNKGFDQGTVCLIMDAVTEAELKATPKVAGAAGGFVIENGKCAGYDYVVSHFVNSELNASNSLVTGTGRYFMIGYWEWFAVQQHGTIRMSVDATSQAVAKKNITAITLNTSWSFTDLSVYINGANGVTQAFACYAVMSSGTNQVLACQHAVSVAKNGTKTLSAVTNLEGATISYAVTTALSGLSVNSSTGVITAGSTAGTAVITVTATKSGVSVTDTVTVTVA